MSRRASDFEEARPVSTKASTMLEEEMDTTGIFVGNSPFWKVCSKWVWAESADLGECSSLTICQARRFLSSRGWPEVGIWCWGRLVASRK